MTDVAPAEAGIVVAPTKLCVPAGDGASPLRLRATSAVRLALVDGPGARALAQEDGRLVAWLTLDPEDADPIRLWRGAIAALRTVAPGFGGDAEAMLCAGPAALAEAVIPLVAAEVATLGEPVTLVLDRFEALGERAEEALPSLTVWLDVVPEDALLVVAGAPPEAAAALRAAVGDATVSPRVSAAPAGAAVGDAQISLRTPAAPPTPATPRTPGTPSARFDAALAAGEPATAAAIVAAVWPATLARGEQATVLAWLRALPPEVAGAEDDLYLVRLWASLERGALQDAERQLAEADVAPALRASGHLLHAHDALRRGDLPRLTERLDAASRHDAAADADGYWHTFEALLRGQEAFWRGHPRIAHRHFARAAGLAHLHGDRYALTAALGHLARLATEGGDDDAARRRLGRVADVTDADPAVAEHAVAFAGALAEARMLELAGALESSVAPLHRAIALAQRGGSRFERVEPRLRLAAVHRACQRAELAEVLEADAVQILSGCPEPGGRLAGPAAAIASPGGPTAHQTVAAALTPSELAVLRLLPSGLSQREIGARLFLSVNTVKTHCRNIYAKLHAQSREEAVARAHDRGLL
ncbi:MAG TPA: LuxR C-terminal-related transcriptional regulator [Baekduia sp.]